MPAILPRDPRQLIVFAQVHAPVWQEHASELGLSAEQVQTLVDRTGEGDARRQAAVAARQASLTATQAYYHAAGELREILGRCMSTIHATAAQSEDPGATYTAASVPVPKKPGRGGAAGEPAQPQELRFSVQSTGAVQIRWSCRQPAGVSGVVTLVYRKLPSDTDFCMVDVVGGKSFTDETLPAGTPSAMYMLQGRRGDRVGPLSHVLTVSFGTSVKSHTPSTAAKLAA